ncbi:MAG: hypothetical protein AUG46_03635, partial [Acidobacteria bacterium 13_1_20CM_3_58_11]
TVIALPLLDAMVPALTLAKNTAANPTARLGFVYVPNGIIMERWTPISEGAGFAFSPIMQALEPFSDRLLVLSGLAQVNGRALGDGAGDHARAGATWLTGVHPKKTEGANIQAGISADQIAARELGKTTQLGSLEIGLESPTLAGDCDSGYSCAYTNTISWRSPTTPNPMEVDPRAVFERLFGDGDSTDPASRLASLNEQRSILDYVAADVNRLKGELAASDRNKLTEYLEAIRDIERRIQKAEEQNATMQLPVMERPSSIPEEFDDHARLMMDLIVIAYQTDMTRVVSCMIAREGSNRSYRSIGVADGHHSVTHHQNDPEKIEKTAKINHLHTQTFAYLLEKMRSIPDGDGTLLDHSMILYGSSISDGNAHTHDNLPLVLAGGGCGQIKGNRHIRFAKETPMNNLLLTMLSKAGLHPLSKLGDSNGFLEDISEV